IRDDLVTGVQTCALPIWAVGQISLHRPPANAYNQQFALELDEAVETVRADDRIQAAVLTSTLPRFFSAGADVKFFQASTLPQKEIGRASCREAVDVWVVR